MELLIFGLFGLIFGSFLNVVILRVPENQSTIFISSHCRNCKTPLKPWHNIPLLSWIFLRGRCAYCSTKISPQYPIIEAISALIFMMILNKLSLSFASLMVAFSFLTLLALSMIDFKYKMIPDSLNILAMLFGVMAAWSLSGLMLNLQNALLFAGGFTLLRFILSYLLTASTMREMRKNETSWSKNYDKYPYIEAMGEGDIMVAATMGALLGVKLTLVAIFFSALLALPVMLALRGRSQEEQRVAFVPFLAMATLIVYIFDSPILAYVEANY